MFILLKETLTLSEGTICKLILESTKFLRLNKTFCLLFLCVNNLNEIFHIWTRAQVHTCPYEKLTWIILTSFLSKSFMDFLDSASLCTDLGTFGKHFLSFINTSVAEPCQMLALYPSQFLKLLLYFNILSHCDTYWFSETNKYLRIKESKLPFSYTSVLSLWLEDLEIQFCTANNKMLYLKWEGKKGNMSSIVMNYKHNVPERKQQCQHDSRNKTTGCHWSFT